MQQMKMKTAAGVIAWMHMFSPAKSWMLGLKDLRKPLLHLHTQFNEEIPYDTLDMGFININQSAHGDQRVCLYACKNEERA